MEIAATSIQIPFFHPSGIIHAHTELESQTSDGDGFIVDCATDCRFDFRGVENELLIADICNAAGDD